MPVMKMMNVMIVEDSSDLRSLMRLVFEGTSIRLQMAVDGQDALEQLRSAPQVPDLIILDLMMPRMNGWEFLEHRERDARLKSIEVVVCSATDEMSLPNVSYMKKPLDMAALRETVERFRPTA